MISFSATGPHWKLRTCIRARAVREYLRKQAVAIVPLISGDEERTRTR
jgi:hypothetical protein